MFQSGYGGFNGGPQFNPAAGQQQGGQPNQQQQQMMFNQQQQHFANMAQQGGAFPPGANPQMMQGQAGMMQNPGMGNMPANGQSKSRIFKCYVKTTPLTVSLQWPDTHSSLRSNTDSFNRCRARTFRRTSSWWEVQACRGFP